MAVRRAAGRVRPMPGAARTLFTPLPADDDPAARRPFDAAAGPAYRSWKPFPSRIFRLYLSIRAARVRDFFAPEKWMT